MKAYEKSASSCLDFIPSKLWESDLPVNLIVSRNKNGSSLSVVGDNVWYAPPVTACGTNFSLSFNFRVNNLLVEGEVDRAMNELRTEEAKKLMLFLMFLRGGGHRGWSQLGNMLVVIKKICVFAEKTNISIRDVLIDSDALGKVLISESRCLRNQAVTLLNHFSEPRFNTVMGFEVAEPRFWNELVSEKMKFRKNYKQTAPFPMRIYSELISSVGDELDEIENHADNIMAALSCAFGVFKNRGKFSESAREGIYLNIISKYSLSKFMTDRGYSITIPGLCAVFSGIFQVCKLQIHLFSGMRSHEARHLPFHCMNILEVGHGRRHCIIEGVTTKFERGAARSAEWITTEKEGFRAIKIAQKFSQVIYSYMNINPRSEKNIRERYPLFVSLSHLPWVGRGYGISDNEIHPATLCFHNCTEELKNRICPIIREEDIAELEEIDQFRAWDSDREFRVGERWLVKMHQCRRSLALYANASGIVRLSTLRQQLQHITNEMAMYYAKGSVYAKNFLALRNENQGHKFASEWRSGGEEAAALSFKKEVLESDEPLWGPSGTYYSLLKKRGEVISVEDVKQQVKLGRLSYRTTPLGGCTNPNPCLKNKGLRMIDISCAEENCKHLVGKRSKIFQVIAALKFSLEQTERNSVNYMMGLEELKSLEAISNAWTASAD